MTRDERLMLAAQGAADPELMGTDVHRPLGVSAAEAMREAAAVEAVKLGMTIRAVGSKEFADSAKMVNFIGSVADMMEGLGVVIDTIPLPTDPRDAEIARLRANLEKCAGQFEFLSRMASSPRPRATDKSDTRTKWVIIKDECEAGTDFIRAALAQSGGAK